jgi:hypothetical protein
MDLHHHDWVDATTLSTQPDFLNTLLEVNGCLTSKLYEICICDTYADAPALAYTALMLTEERGVKLRFIGPDKPRQNAYIESFNGKLRDECLNQPGSTTCRRPEG